MTLSEWRDRLQLMARSSICHLEPHEAADLFETLDNQLLYQSQQLDRIGVLNKEVASLRAEIGNMLEVACRHREVESDEALPEREPFEKGRW